VTRFIYNIAFHLFLPVIFLRLLWRSMLTPSYMRRWRERLGIVSAPQKSHHWSERFGFVRTTGEVAQYSLWIWIHAVSVGESTAAAPLIRKLKQEHPDWGIVVTSMTPTGSDRIRSLFGDQICHVYAPYDYSGAVNRFLKVFRPALVVLVETELWPNLIHYSKARGAQVMVINARLSEKSCRGYERLAALSKPMLRQIDCIAAQTVSDAARFRRLGVPEHKLEVTGNVKFELEFPADLELRKAALAGKIDGQRPIWIAASTRDGEDSKVLRAFKQCLQTLPDLLLILVPRHPERFRTAEKLCEEQGLPVVTRSSGEAVSLQTKVFLGDSMGELLVYYSISDVAFVGGSLVDTGCQNVLEPAALGLPVFAGPSQFNFAAACEILESAGNLQTVADESALAAAIVNTLTNPALKARKGAAGRQSVEENRGALERTYRLVLARLAGAVLPLSR